MGQTHAFSKISAHQQKTTLIIHGVSARTSRADGIASTVAIWTSVHQILYI